MHTSGRDEFIVPRLFRLPEGGHPGDDGPTQARRWRHAVACGLPRRERRSASLSTMRSINGAITSPAAGIEQPAISRLGALITRSRQQSRLDRRAPGAREHVSFGVDGDAAAADDVERELMGICESLLGVRPGRHDSLFGCGIDSLTALRLTAQCEKRFKCQLPAATLFTAPSVAQLAQVLRERTTAAAWSSLVAFQSRGSRPPRTRITASSSRDAAGAPWSRADPEVARGRRWGDDR